METSSKGLFLDTFSGDSGTVVQTGAYDSHLMTLGSPDVVGDSKVRSAGTESDVESYNGQEYSLPP